MKNSISVSAGDKGLDVLVDGESKKVEPNASGSFSFDNTFSANEPGTAVGDPGAAAQTPGGGAPA